MRIAINNDFNYLSMTCCDCFAINIIKCALKINWLLTFWRVLLHESLYSPLNAEVVLWYLSWWQRDNKMSHFPVSVLNQNQRNLSWLSPQQSSDPGSPQACQHVCLCFVPVSPCLTIYMHKNKWSFLAAREVCTLYIKKCTFVDSFFKGLSIISIEISYWLTFGKSCNASRLFGEAWKKEVYYTNFWNNFTLLWLIFGLDLTWTSLFQKWRNNVFFS